MRSVALLLLSALACSSAAEARECPEAQAAALTLTALLARGLCLDPKITQQQAELDRARGAIDEAAAGRAWQLSLQAGPSASTQQGTGGGQHSASASGGLVASNTLADGGLVRSRTAQREREAAAAIAELEAARQDTLRELAGLWSDAREAQAAVITAARLLDAARATEAAARARLAAGTATRVDALSAASTLAQAERDVINADVTWRQRQARLAERLGWPAERELGLRDDEQDLLARLAPTLGATPSTAPLDIHPQALAQRERVLAQRAALDATRTDERATVKVSGSTGPNLTRGNQMALTGYEITKRWSSEVGVTWSMPLTDGGARRLRNAQSQSALDSALAQQETIERGLREAYWQQWTAWRGADADLRAAQAALAAAQAAEGAQRGRYQAGAGTLADWITALSDLSSRMRQAASAEQSRLRAAVGTAHALGRLNLDANP